MSRPSVDIPYVQIDYPVINRLPEAGDFPEQAEPDANNSKNNKKSEDDASKARELSSKLPLNANLQQLIRPPASLQADGNLPSQTKPQPAPVGPVAPVQVEPKAPTATVTLPFLGTVPLPSKENVALASTTAVTATFVAVLGKAAFEASLEGIKPLLRLAAIRYKKMRNRALSDQEMQMEFSFNMKRRGKRTFRQSMADLRDYFRENFFDDLIGGD